MQAQELVLRDVHVPAAPSLWPPAPGWWLVVLAVALIVGAAWWWRRQRRLRRQAWLKLFEEARDQPSSAAQVAAISELLRRAARRVDASADHLQGEAWLAFLDGKDSRDFSDGAGRLLLEGGFRKDVPAADLKAVSALARVRFLELMAGRR